MILAQNAITGRFGSRSIIGNHLIATVDISKPDLRIASIAMERAKHRLAQNARTVGLLTNGLWISAVAHARILAG